MGTALGLLNNRTAFTVTGWLKRGAVKSTRGGYFGQNDLLEFGDAGGGTQIEAWVNATGGNVLQTYPMADNVWGFIAMTGDATTCRLTIHYYDPADSTHKVISGTRAGVANFGTNAFNFNIGGGGIFNNSGDYFRGEIDEVAVFDKALSPGRIQQLYDAAVGAVAPTADVPTVAPGTTVSEGASYTLTVDPSGTPPFTYQWKENGVDIPGATGKTYTVTSAVPQSPVTNPFSYTVTITNAGGSYTTTPAVDVYVSPILVWKGEDGTNPTYWDISTTANWQLLAGGGAVSYSNDYAVVFGDAGVGTTVDIQADMEPQEVAFTGSKNYTLNGAFGIWGSAAVSKSGSGTLTLNSNNGFSGPLSITGGTVEVSAANHLGASGGSLFLNGGNLHATASHTIGRKATVPGAATGTIVVDSGVQLLHADGFKGGGTLVKQGDGTLRFEGYGGGAFVNGNIRVEQGTLAMAGGAFNTSIGLASILVKSGATLLQPAGAYHALGGAWTNTPAITLEPGATYTANQENYVSVLNLTGATVNGTADLRSDYGFQINVLASPALSTWAVTLNGVVTPLNISVADGSGAVDFLLSGNVTNTQPMNLTGAGTMSMTGPNCSISGLTTVGVARLMGTAALAGPMTVNAGSVIAPGSSIGTISAGTTTLNGTYECEISGAACDLLKVTGDLTLAAGSAIQITASSPTAPVYQIATYTGTLTDAGCVFSGVPAGYEVIKAFSSILIAQAGLNFNAAIAQTPAGGAASLATSDFNANDGGFTVSAPVTSETDWTYAAGSWTSAGQEAQSGTGNNLSYLTSPVFTLTKSGVFTLTFSHRYTFEPGYDGGVVEFSINGGAYQRVPASAFSQNGYNATIGADGVAALANQQAFGGSSAGHPAFVTSVCRPGAANAGDTVRVRFLAAYDWATSGSTTDPDWEIDSYELSEGGAGGAHVTWPIGILQYSDNLQPPWTDLPNATSPYFIDTTLAPRRFFRVKP